MRITDVPFALIDWSRAEESSHAGESGTAHWWLLNFGDVRIRLVEYSPGYLADHWCSKGHLVFCLEGGIETELADGGRFVIRAGGGYTVSDGTDPHRSSSEAGAKLIIVD